MAQHLDARGLLCPLPRLRAAQGLSGLGPGEELVVLADDPESPLDIAALALAGDVELEQRMLGDGVFEFRLRRPRGDCGEPAGCAGAGP